MTASKLKPWQKWAYRILIPLIAVQGIAMMFDGDLIGVFQLLVSIQAFFIYRMQVDRRAEVKDETKRY